MTDGAALIFNHPNFERAAAHLAKQAGVDIETGAAFMRNPSAWKTQTALKLVARLPRAQKVLADVLPAESAASQMRAARLIQRNARLFLKDLDPAEHNAICDQIDADAGEGPRLRELVAQLRKGSR